MIQSISAFLLCTLISIEAIAAPPNIILIMTDDQGYGDLGVTGNRDINTPNIDAMASRSAELTTFYVSPVCAPTRACLMTGRYNYRTRCIDTWIGRAMMEPDEVTIAEALRDNGYATGIFGKWHLGDCYPMRPNDQGFDESLIHKGGGLAQPADPIENNRRYTDPILFHNGKQVNTKGYCSDVYFSAALTWMKSQQNQNKPFFIYLPMNAPHGPYHDVPNDLYQKYKAKDLSQTLLDRKKSHDNVARIFAMIENVDQNVGRVFKQLNSLNITENTIVIFMVDNGPNSMRYVGNMRGMKSHVHEGGIRSPFYIHWPARLRAGMKVKRVAAHIDVMPTLLAAAGASPPKNVKFDGINLLPLLEGAKARMASRNIYIQSHRGDAPIRYQHFAMRSDRWKLLRSTGFGADKPVEGKPFELYDILNDPGEKNNLATKRPDLVRSMKAQYDQWFDDVSATRPNNYAPPRIIVGTDHETRTSLTQQDWRKTAGNGWGTHGHWLLTVARESTFDVTVIFTAPQSGNAELSIGSMTKSVQVEKAANRLQLRSVKFPKGDASLNFTITSKGKSLGPYQVILTRK